MSAAPAPIALFVYNRPLHTRQTVEALLANELAADCDLVIFSDAPRSPQASTAVSQVRDYIRTIRGFRSIAVRERATNAGLAKSITEGVTELCEQRGAVIVLEDDLVTSPWFLTYMNQALAMYADDERVASVHGYSFPSPTVLPETFFLRGADCWGWGTWKRAWRHFEPDGAKLLQALTAGGLTRAFDLDGDYQFTKMLRGQVRGQNDSWAVRWHAACFLNNHLTLYPGRSLVRNIGNDASGTHCDDDDTNAFATVLATKPIDLRRIEIEACEEGRKAFGRFLRGTRRGGLRRYLKRVVKRIGSSA